MFRLQNYGSIDPELPSTVYLIRYLLPANIIDVFNQIGCKGKTKDTLSTLHYYFFLNILKIFFLNV